MRRSPFKGALPVAKRNARRGLGIRDLGQECVLQHRQCILGLLWPTSASSLSPSIRPPPGGGVGGAQKEIGLRGGLLRRQGAS